MDIFKPAAKPYWLRMPIDKLLIVLARSGMASVFPCFQVNFSWGGNFFMNAQTSRFRQLNRSYEWPLHSPCASGSVLNASARVCIFHAHTIVAKSLRGYMRMHQVLPVLTTTAWYTCSLTACEPELLLLGRSFRTSRCPKLKVF